MTENRIMLPRFGRVGVLAFVGLVVGLTPAAWGQFGAIQRFLFQGSEYVGDRDYISTPQGGPLYDYNLFDQRVEWNRLGQGLAWDSYRFFGPDSFGNPNTLDLGFFKMQLGQGPSLLSGQPVGIRNRVGVNTRFIPEAFFEVQTGQRGFNQFSGISNFSPAPVNYTITMNTGVQDFTWTGNALINAKGNINAMGFYDLQMRFTNVGEYTADGLLIHDEQVTDFDIGPINASGNLGLDALASLLQANGNTTDAVGPRAISGAAAREKLADLVARLQAGETLSEDDARFLAEQMFASAFQADPFGVLQNGLPNQIPGFEGVTLNMLSSPNAPAGGSTTPEPGTLVLVAASVGTALWARRLGLARSVGA